MITLHCKNLVSRRIAHQTRRAHETSDGPPPCARVEVWERREEETEKEDNEGERERRRRDAVRPKVAEGAPEQKRVREEEYGGDL